MKKTILISTIATLLATPAFADELDPLPATERHQQAYEYREDRANINFLNSPAAHPTNGDES